MRLSRFRKLLVISCVGGLLYMAYLLYRGPLLIPSSWKRFPSGILRSAREELLASNPSSQTSLTTTAILKHHSTASLTNSSKPLASVHRPTEIGNTTVAAKSLSSVRSVTTTSSLLPKPSPQTTTSQGTNKKPTKLLCVDFTGRLGNELFVYASTLGLALTMNRIPVFRESTVLSSVLKHFSVSPANLSKSELDQRCSKGKRVGETSCCQFDQSLVRLNPKFDYHIKKQSYLQSYRYFEKYESRIREAIVFSDAIQNKSRQVVQKLRQKYNSSTLVAVHIRHGDMALERNQKLGYPLATPAYINRSLTYFKKLYPDSVFVVASDSPGWCKENFPFGFPVHFLQQNAPAVDMQILSSLDHIVISFGTFSWWMGFRNPGKTVYMKDFVIPNTRIGKKFNPDGKDYIYPGWIGL